MLTLFTDPHLGLNRSSHTTLNSRALLRKKVFDQAMLAVSKKRQHLVCLGDLFDEYSNEESVIEQGLKVVQSCDLVLAGNHDVVNRADQVGSLQLLANLGHESIAINQFGETSNYKTRIGGQNFTIIPHVHSQEAFVACLNAAAADENSASPILLLHCNVGNDMLAGNETALNLSLELAQELLKVYAFIVVGHEHEPKTYLGGRLIVLGNTMPLGFGEIADRFVYHFDPDTKVFEKERIWSAADNFKLIDATGLINAEGAVTFPEAVQLVEIEGSVNPEDMPAFSRALVKFWKANPGLLMVRNNIEIVGITLTDGAKQPFGKIDLTSVIRNNLQSDKPLLELFNELVQEQA